ncbi:MAG: type IX secretion system protein PorQ [Bacteroidota bacterium]|nr:type IX secretion system protein PorQ [Bacteroidota bacterium]
MEQRLITNKLIGCLFLLYSTALFSQAGGKYVYQFINLSPSARITALGGFSISYPGSDPAIAYQNPALLNESMHTALSFNHQNYFTDISSGNFSYSHFLAKPKVFLQAGVQYFNSGDFIKTDAFGNINGSAKANESNFYLAAGKQLNERMHVGLSSQFIFSKLDQYSSSALAFNSSVLYFIPDQRLGISLLFRNMGFQLTKYDQQAEKLPFEVLMALSKKLKHLPFVYHITFRHFEKWNISYNDEDLDSGDSLLGGNTEDSEFEKAAGNFFRHLVFGGELLLGKKENFSIRLGYNHLRKKDLGVKDYRSFGGLSFGLGVKVYKFKIDYGYALYHIAGGAHHFGLTTNLTSFYKTEM